MSSRAHTIAFLNATSTWRGQASLLVDGRAEAELRQLYPAASEAQLTDAIIYVHADLRADQRREGS